ncbi:MAG: phytoene desaturase family protein [Ignavibacteria bacterium]|nr:phytoene desaturase family protein [Ignavibacteria bacterium]
MAKRKNVAIIGAGLGGLSAAIRLAHSGFNVDVFEKNSNAGGKANQIYQNGFRFDTGPTLITMPFVIEELFKEVNECIGDFLQLEELDVVCKYFYPDKTTLLAYSNTERLISEFSNKTKDSANSITKFLKYSEDIYKLTAELFLFKSFSELKTFFNINALKTLLLIWKIDPFRSMHSAISSFFEDSKTIQFFDRYATYNGSNPFLAPATLNIIPYVEHKLKAVLPKQGIFQLSDAIYKLAVKAGVKFQFECEVKEILVKDNRVQGMIFAYDNNLREKNYDVIISNADVNTTYKNLLPHLNLKSAKRYARLEPSSSALVFYWGIKGIHQELETHNILFSESYKKEFDELFSQKICPNDPTIYIYISSKKNKNDAPDGSENWYVMINAPYNDNQNWNDIVFKMRKKILEKIKIQIGIDLNNKIVCESFTTPLDIENKTGSFRGSLYGISSNSRYSAFMRQQNRSKEIKGLYFCGGSAHPGGGIPLVILSGKITAELINKYESSS